MITINWCNKCKTWKQFHKEGRYPKENIRWKCERCGWKTMTFPEYENPITWILSGRRPK